MKSKKTASMLLTVTMTTAVLAGPAAQAAQTVLTASPSAQKFYVDGQQVRLRKPKAVRMMSLILLLVASERALGQRVSFTAKGFESLAQLFDAKRH